MKKYIGPSLVILISLITLNFWFLAKSGIGEIFGAPVRSISQVFALEGLILMSLSLVLATRLRFIENTFAGIDQVYNIHKILGSISFLFLLNHPFLLALQSMPNFKNAFTFIFPGSLFPYNLGVAALYLMIFSFMFMIFIKLPYHFWRLTHRLLGVSFLLGGVHGFLVSSDISSFIFLKVWVLFFIGFGGLSYLYTLFFYKKFGPRYVYRVEKVMRELDVVHIYLTPVFKKMAFEPGQFIYIRFDNKLLGEEEHPFSISSATQDNFLRISAKILGDYTLRLPNLRQGNLAYIYGPYGNFNENNFALNTAKIWIAGGIGVTPFMSMIRQNFFRETKKPVDFIYSYSTQEEAIFKKEIEERLNANTNIRCIFWCSKEQGRLTAEKVSELAGNLSDKNIYLCGPEVMMSSLRNQFLKIGVEENQILFENFNLL